MFLLNKLLPWFVLPLGVSLLLIVAGLFRRRRRVIVAGVVVLLVFSNPLVGHYLIRSAEAWAERRPGTDVPAADAVVVLSAGQSLAPGPARIVEWSDANRFFAGVDLMLASKAPLLVFTGAAVSSMSGVPNEGEILSVRAQGLGVPAERMVVTPAVLNTADEARAVAELLRARQVMRPRVLLVTSAFHMRRARQLFEEEGVVVDPFPVSFSSPDLGSLTVLSVLPSVRALADSQTAIREMYGRAFYWLRSVVAPR